MPDGSCIDGNAEAEKEGKLQDQEESDEINACSIVVPVEVDGVEEEWLVNFKNETHNHPTRSNHLVVQLPALVEQSVTRCQDVLMYTRQCV